MLYLSICKDYQKISLYFFDWDGGGTRLRPLFVKSMRQGDCHSMLLSLTIGFFLTAVLEYATVKRYFKRNSNRYRRVFFVFWQVLEAGGDQFFVYPRSVYS